MAALGSVTRVQDAVHGLMEFRGLEASVIDLLRARELQRLRRIRQLGLAHLVFPAAEHSRLAHALGAAHIAIRFARRLDDGSDETLTAMLRPDEEARRDLAIAALCHDLGHGPLSHTFEREVIRDDFDRSAWTASLGLSADSALDGLKWHELVGQAILAWPDGELHRLLEEQEEGTAERVRLMLLGQHYLSYLPRLLSSDVDVDRCDFLLRDAHQSGVAYGRFDLSWLISTAAVGLREDGELVIGFDKRKAPRVIEQLIVARRALYDTVYQHKTVRAAEGMVGLLLRRLRDVVEAKGWLFQDEALFAPYKDVLQGKPLSTKQVLELDDYSLWVLMSYVAESRVDDTASDLARRIVERDLFKNVPVPGQRIEAFLGMHGRERLYPLIAPHCAGEAQYYLHVEYSELTTLGSDSAHEVYFIEPGGDGVGYASVAREHPEIQPLFRPDKGLSCRLFAPAEALPQLIRVLGS